MRILDPVETEEYALEVIRCECGFHIGIDADHLDQVGPVDIKCPICEEMISAGAF